MKVILDNYFGENIRDIVIYIVNLIKIIFKITKN